MTVPAEICVDVRPYGLGDDGAALAQPVAIAVHSMRRGRLQPGEQALVIGAGGIGVFLLYAAVELGARVAVADLDEVRLGIARDLGAHDLIDAREGPLPELLAARGIRPDVDLRGHGQRRRPAQRHHVGARTARASCSSASTSTPARSTSGA